MLGRADLLADPRLASNNERVLARGWMLPELAATLRGFDSAALAAALERAEVPFAAIMRPEQLFDDPHLLQSGGLVALKLEDGSTTPMPLLPLALDGRRLEPRRALPRIGEHSRDVMRRLGYADAQIEELARADRKSVV